MGTENIILLVLVVVVVAIGLWSTVRHSVSYTHLTLPTTERV